MTMYLVSDEELNTIIRLRRRDVTRLVTDLKEQYPDASVAEIVAAADQYFAEQTVAYDYLADYAAEEIAYSTPEPAAVIDEPLEEDYIASIDEDPRNVDPLTDENVDPNTLEIIDDTVQIIDDTTPEDADLEPAAIELAQPEPDLSFAAETVSVPEQEDTDAEPVAEESTALEPLDSEVANEVAARDDRASRISLRALQRELKQIDRI